MAAALHLQACSALPPAADSGPSLSLPPMSQGPLAATAEAAREASAGRDAVLLVDDAGEALTWRLALLDSARSSIDMQYFTWGGGASGHLMLQRLWAADFLFRWMPLEGQL